MGSKSTPRAGTPLSRSLSGVFRRSSDEDSHRFLDLERLRSLMQGATGGPTSRGRTLHSPPQTPGHVSFGSSENGLSEFDEAGFELPPSAHWSVDPNLNIPENFSLSGVDLTSARLPERMKDLMDDYAYWLSVVERLGFDRSIFRFDETPSLEVLSRFYDSSHLGLLRVFHIFDKDRDALITRPEIAEGLQQQGFYTNIGSQSADLAFEELCDLLTRHAPNEVVSPPEFLLALRCLRLGAVVHGYMHPLHPDEDEDDIILHYHEYREDKMSANIPLEGPISFLFRSPDEEQTSQNRVHWIHSHEPSVRTVLALGIKYGLDPRFTLDVLSLWSQQALVDRALSYVARTRGAECGEHEQAFLDREWIFAIVPVFKLSETSRNSMIPFTEWKLADLRRRTRSVHGKGAPPEVFIEVDSCNFSMFVTGQALGGTMISFSTEWSVLGEVDTSNEVSVLENCPTKWSAAGGSGDFQPVSRIMSHLKTSYSHLRTGDCHTLFLKALCDITEDYVSVMQSYEAVLTILRIRLDEKMDSLEHFEVKRIQACLRQVNQILRLVRPVGAVVDILESREWSGESQLYLSDLRANIARFFDNAGATRETAKLLGDQFKNFCETKTRKVLFALTLVTTMFVPGIFLTSLEGMNFEGHMPELQLKYGYFYFWLVMLVIVFGLFMFYKQKKWI